MRAFLRPKHLAGKEFWHKLNMVLTQLNIVFILYPTNNGGAMPTTFTSRRVRCFITIKTATMRSTMSGVFANTSQAWDAAWEVAGTPEATISVRVVS
jgi:hypothetical protein